MAAEHALGSLQTYLQRANQRVELQLDDQLKALEQRQAHIAQYREAYRQYCWPVKSLGDYRLAPFHIMATEQGVHTDKTHTWHMEQLAELVAADPDFLFVTEFRVVKTSDKASCLAAAEWWETLTAKGGEGIVVKPQSFIFRGSRGLVQPAVKVRGREYLRIIYGPEYTAPKHMQGLKKRGLKRKRSLAVREFALGIEALERFVAQRPLRDIHRCVFGVLALESEPVDPRL